MSKGTRAVFTCYVCGVQGSYPAPVPSTRAALDGWVLGAIEYCPACAKKRRKLKNGRVPKWDLDWYKKTNYHD